MQSPNIFRQNNLLSPAAPANTALRAARPSLTVFAGAAGFTLIEILVVTAVLTLIIGLGLFMSMDIYRGFSSRSERDVVVSVLQKARSRAINNYHQTPWGVCYQGGSYIMFRYTGVMCPSSPTNEAIPASPSASVAGLTTGVVFSQLSGTTTGATVTVTQNGKTSTITINYEGAIIW